MVDVSRIEHSNHNVPETESQGPLAKSAPVNSIYTVNNKESVDKGNVTNTLRLDEFIEKLCAEFSNLGLNPEDLKRSGVLFRITGKNQEQLEKANENELRKVFDCLKEAIKDCTKNGEIDLEAVGELANNYYIVSCST